MANPAPTSPLTPIERICLALILALGVWLATPGMTQEAPVALAGDSARYIMNGVFFYDFIADGGRWSVDEIVRYAELYYARYPALSLGHHPPPTSLALVPFYAVFGISLLAARIAALMFFLLAIWGLFALGRRTLGNRGALWAALFFVTNPFVVQYAQLTLSEMPMLVLVFGATNALHEFCTTGRRRAFAWFALAVVASLYTRQLAALMLPVYLVALVVWGGTKRLRDRKVLAIAAVAALALVPLAVATLVLSPFNVTAVRNSMTALARGRRRQTALEVLSEALTAHLTIPMALAIVAGLTWALWRKDATPRLLLGWIGLVFGGMVVLTGGLEPARYSIAAIPAFVLGAAAAGMPARSRLVTVSIAVLLAAVAGVQAMKARTVRPVGGSGYEAAARFVQRSSSATVLFNGAIDTGYFSFFVRKHDPAKRLVVLRSDKLFTTSSMARQEVQTQVSSTDEMHQLLRTFGVRFIVHEDRPVRSRTLEMLRAELATSRFAEVLRVPIDSSDRRVQGADLVVYEYLEAQDPDPAADLNIRIPMGRRNISLTLGDLIGRRPD